MLLIPPGCQPRLLLTHEQFHCPIIPPRDLLIQRDQILLTPLYASLFLRRPQNKGQATTEGQMDPPLMDETYSMFLLAISKPPSSTSNCQPLVHMRALTG